MSRRARVPPAVTTWVERDAVALAGVEKLRFFPLVVERGEGVELVEPGGRRLLDLSASWTASGFGHGDERIAEAVRRAVSASPGSSVLSAIHPDAVGLAEELLAIVPARGDEARRVYLGHAGTDANEVAIRGSRHATGRQRILAFENGYHGGLGTAQAASGVHVAAGVTADPGTEFLPYPSSFGLTPGECVRAREDALDNVRREFTAGDVAAVLVEPLQSDGGVIVPPPGFLAGLRDLCDRFNALLIVDEVKVGLGRTGRTHAFEHDGIVPDVVTLGKALGGGLPLSATIGPASVLDEPVASALMTTVGNPISCAAARAVLHHVREGHLTANAAARGDQIIAGLRAYRASGRPGAAHVADVRGRGLALGIELVDANGEGDSTLTAKASYRAWEVGAVCYPVRGNVLEVTPPLIIDEATADRAVELLATAIDDAVLGQVSDAQVAPYNGW